MKLRREPREDYSVMERDKEDYKQTKTCLDSSVQFFTYYYIINVTSINIY